MQTLTYGYNTQVYGTKKTSPFSLVLDRESPGTLVSDKIRTTEETSTMWLVQAMLNALENLTLHKQQTLEAKQRARE